MIGAGHDAKGHWEVVGRALLGDICWRHIDGDPFSWVAKTRIDHGRKNAEARFLHGRIWQSYQIELSAFDYVNFCLYPLGFYATYGAAMQSNYHGAILAQAFEVQCIESIRIPYTSTEASQKRRRSLLERLHRNLGGRYSHG